MPSGSRRYTGTPAGVDERTGIVDTGPAWHQPLSFTRDKETGKSKVEMAAGACAGCLFRKQCPIVNTDEGRYVLEYTDRQRHLAARRREQETKVFKERYAMRSGIESTNSGVKNRLGLGKLPVRGRGSVYRVVWHKLAGWNVLRAAAARKLRHGSNARHSLGVAGADARRATPPDPRLVRWGLARCCQLDPSHPALLTREDPGVEPCLIPCGWNWSLSRLPAWPVLRSPLLKRPGMGSAWHALHATECYVFPALREFGKPYFRRKFLIDRWLWLFVSRHSFRRQLMQLYGNKEVAS